MNGTTCIVGDTICGSAGVSKFFSGEEEVFLRGYNTYECDRTNDSQTGQEGYGEIVAAISGQIEVTDRVVSVKGMSFRYHPEIGDIVIGRVKEVYGNRWRIDIGAFQEAVMLLSNVTEPGGILRRRGRSDELAMRHIFDQDDLIVAEVQRISPDGVVSLHTRSGERYGKLSNLGVLVLVSPALVKRAKHQFLTLDFLRIGIIVGLNGMIWVSPEGQEKNGMDTFISLNDCSDNDVKRGVARVANCIKVLGHAQFPIFANSISSAVKSSIDSGLSPFEILLPSNEDLIMTTVMKTLTTRKHLI